MQRGSVSGYSSLSASHDLFICSLAPSSVRALFFTQCNCLLNHTFTQIEGQEYSQTLLGHMALTRMAWWLALAAKGTCGVTTSQAGKALPRSSSSKSCKNRDLQAVHGRQRSVGWIFEQNGTKEGHCRQMVH